MIFDSITYCEDEIQTIVDLNLSWNDIENEQLKIFKNTLYSNLRTNGSCPYCRRKLQRKKYDQIDHIIYKADYNQYAFHPLNLVLACARCNNNKLNKNVLFDCHIEHFKRLDWRSYPSDGSFFKIVHPYYDNYELHIEKKFSVFYQSKPGSEKGYNTIEMMNLYGFDLLEENVKIINDTSREFISKYISNPDYDSILILWAEFIMIDYSILESLFDILIAFEKGSSIVPIISEEDYYQLKNQILCDAIEKQISFQISFSGSAKFIKIINSIDNVEMLKKYIEAFELLYKMKDLDKSFEATLFLSIIVLVKLKNNKYTKSNLKKYLLP